MIRYENELTEDSRFPVEIFEQNRDRGPVWVDDHWHECFELLWMREGTAEQRVNGRLLPLAQDDILLLYSGDVHATRCPEDQRVRIFVLKFMPSVLDARYSHAHAYRSIHLAGFLNRERKESGPLPAVHRRALQPILETIEREKEQGLPGSGYYIRSGILQLVGYLVRQGLIRTLSPDQPPPEAEAVDHIVQYMEEHFSEEITLKNIADLAHLNYTYASRYFKRLTGRNFKQYLDYIRTTEATMRLLAGGRSVTEVAEECGFASPQAMTRTYTRIMGYPPSLMKR